MYTVRELLRTSTIIYNTTGTRSSFSTVTATSHSRIFRSFPVLIYAPVFAVAVADNRGQDPASSVLSFEGRCYLFIQIQIQIPNRSRACLILTLTITITLTLLNRTDPNRNIEATKLSVDGELVHRRCMT